MEMGMGMETGNSSDSRSIIINWCRSSPCKGRFPKWSQMTHLGLWCHIALMLLLMSRCMELLHIFWMNLRSVQYMGGNLTNIQNKPLLSVANGYCISNGWWCRLEIFGHYQHHPYYNQHYIIRRDINFCHLHDSISISISQALSFYDISRTQQ